MYGEGSLSSWAADTLESIKCNSARPFAFVVKSDMYRLSFEVYPIRHRT